MKSRGSETRSILVAGGAGYIGSHTCKALAAAGYLPIVLDDLSTGHPWAVRWGPLVEADIADKERISQAIARFDIQAVIHFAARAYVGESMSKPREYFETNVSKTLALFDVFQNCGIDKVVFSSSCATYGIPRKLPICEDHPQEPINPYGASKLFIEQVLKWYGQAYGLRYAVLRYFNAAGADPDAEIGEDHVPETHLVPLIIAAARKKLPAVEIFGTDYNTPDGTAVRDYVHVSDLADAHVSAINRLFAGEQSIVVNLGTGRGHSIRQVVSAVEKVAGVIVPIVEGPRRAGDPPTLLADSLQGQSLLGWTPSRSDLYEIIQTAWNWHAQHDSR
jgi:UDP-arabinose 4-epimerase